MDYFHHTCVQRMKLLAIICICFASFSPALAQQDKAYFNRTSNATVDTVLDFKNLPGTWLSFRTCDEGEIFSQTGGTGDTFKIAITPSGFVEASWTVGATSKSADVGPNYATNTGWIVLKLQYTVGSIVLSVDSNSTTLASAMINSELLAIDLSGGSEVVLGRHFVGCIEQITGLQLDNASSWSNVKWGVCPLEMQQGCQPPEHNPCYSHPCKNQGVCSSKAQGGYLCDCTARYDGDQCENDTGPLCSSTSNPSYSLDCQNGGVCQEDDIGNSTICQCKPEFDGPLCELNRTFTCDDDTCENNGTCTVTDSGVTGVECTCVPGFSGDNCAININECAVHQCLNGGVCIDDIGMYICNCTGTGYSGDRCSDSVYECNTQPCRNGATCVDTSGSFVCLCLPGWTGDLCESDLDECISNPCGNGGTCQNADNAYECQCVLGFNGTDCEVNIDDCVSVTCPLTFDCVDDIDSYTCECPPGKVNVSGTCVNYDECSSNPCTNGDCEDLDNMYRCDCYSGFNGTNCDIDIDECASDPCLMNSTCIDDTDGFNCTCLPGYSGDLCGIDIDECLLDLCENGATCMDAINGFTCDCVPGYEGELCQNNTDDCAIDPCQNNATCFDDINDYSCVCITGFTDKNCSTNIDDCQLDPCQHNATCVDKVDDYKCLCFMDYVGKDCEEFYDACVEQMPCKNGATCTTPPLPSQEYNCTCVPGFNGTNCEINIDDCIGVDCNATSGKVCYDEVGGYLCACPLGYEGPFCSVEINECSSNPCNNGNCSDNVGNFTCTCAPGYTGETCEVNIDECASMPCLNDGLCFDQVNRYQCYCLPGNTGDNCAIDVGECNSDPCKNGGTCEEDKKNQYVCLCVPGFHGVHCENNTDECESNPCENNSTCEDGINMFTCTCTPGFNGTLCDIDIDECAIIPCGPGSCIDAVNNYTCNCTDTGFYGPQCEYNIDDCSPDPCVNEAICSDLIKDYICTCWDGYEGKDCSGDINECLDTPCLNGGICLERSNQSLYDGSNPLLPGEFSYANASGVVCECAAGYEGGVCAIDIDECLSGPCANSGTCNDGVNGYTCSCAGGWEGVECEIEIDECLPVPCQNGATCTDLVNDYNCTCTGEYGGSNCTELLTGCEGNGCQNESTCVPYYDEMTDTHNFTCLCGAGYTGDTCSTDTSAAFDDQSYLRDPTSNGTTTLDYSLSIQTTLPDGILLYSGESETYFLLEMFNGDLYLTYSEPSTGAALEISDFGQPINDGNYHTVTVVVTTDSIILSVTITESTRTRRTATCTGGICQQAINIPGSTAVMFDSMYIGGISDDLVFADKLSLSRSGKFFTGCMQDIRNGGVYILPPGAVTRAIPAPSGCPRLIQCPNGNEQCNDQGTCTDLWLTFTCDCNTGYAGTTCNESFVPATFRFEDNPESYAEFTADDTLSPLSSSIRLAFRTREPNGLIFFTQDTNSNSYIAVEVVNETLLVTASRNGNPASVDVGSELSDGVYHFVSVLAGEAEITVTLEPDSVSGTKTLTSGSSDFTVFSVGGVSDFTTIIPDDAITSDTYFKGCLWDVKYNNYSLQFEPLSLPDFPIPSFPMTTNNSVLINSCESDDTCAATPCENGGTCTVTWNDFDCACPVGYGGKNCSDLTICSRDPCPSGAACQDRPDGHDCVIEATFDGLTSLVTYSPNISAPTDLDTITLRARTRNDIGIIYHSSNSISEHYVTLYLDQGVPVIRFNLEEPGELRSQVAINDAEWYDIEVRFSNKIELSVNNFKTETKSYNSLATLASIITTPGSSEVFLAGSTIVNNDYFATYNYFKGCLDDVRVGDILLPFYDRETINSTSQEQFEATLTDIMYNCQGDSTVCDSNPCENFGTCIDQWNAAACECVPGYTGDNCQTDINECMFNPCALGSTCRDDVNNYTCLCLPGYEGRNCDTEINECDPDPCLQGSACYDGLDFFNCTCLDGYTGTFCDVLINETCTGNPCKNGGTCRDNPGSGVQFECQCPTGFNGDDCGHEIDYCLNHECVNGATCVSIPDLETHRCDCLNGYTGGNCTTNIDDCVGVNCENGATCVDEVNGFTCNCTGGYDGQLCGNDINECSPDPCKFGATCDDLINGFNCVCMPGFDGRYCSIDINECLNSVDPPCQNGGTCTNMEGSFACHCPPDTYGLQCQTAPCDPSPCENNSNCTTRPPGAYDCLCPLGYEGVNCSVASCSSVVCQNNGSCQLHGGNWECICAEFVTGSQCQYKGPCAPDIDPCVNSGTCQQTFQEAYFNYTCDCLIGFNGTNCELEIDWCASNPCQNAGSNCTSTTETYICSCGPGYNGTDCDNKLPDCASSLCQNGASCQDLDYGFKCFCADGYSGEVCQTNIDECAGEPPCQNGGVCSDAVNAFVCNCNGTGYNGNNCTNDIDECATSTPCANNGTCKNSPGTFQCTCKNGWLSPDCSLANPCSNKLCQNGGTCEYTVSADGQSVEYICRCEKDYGGDNCDRFIGSVTNWALIGGVIGGAILLLVVIIVLGIFLVKVKEKRATRGTYSPSRQEITGSKLEMDNIFKLPPEERLI